MKIITYVRRSTLRAGLAVGDWAVDLEEAARALRKAPLPSTVREFLDLGPSDLKTAARLQKLAAPYLRKVEHKLERKPRWAWPLNRVELAPPVPNPEKIICVGQNYIDHCREQGVEPPKTPILFAKFPTTLTGPAGEIRLPGPDLTTKVDYEVELAFVMGREAKRVPRERAFDYVAGYMVLNDITARDVQKGDGQWLRGKSFDTFAPCGPWIVTKDDIPDPSDLPISLKLNGQTMQDSSTRNLIFDIPYLIEFITRGLTLKPGDIISTGTPPGVGIHRNPPVVLKPGDRLEASVEGIGTLDNLCGAA